MSLSRSSKIEAMAVVRKAIADCHLRISKVDATYTAYLILDRLEGFGFTLEDRNAEARKAKQAQFEENLRELRETDS
jgi:hypothetical protein